MSLAMLSRWGLPLVLCVCVASLAGNVWRRRQHGRVVPNRRTAISERAQHTGWEHSAEKDSRGMAAFTSDRNAKVKAALAQPARTRAAPGRRGWKPAEHGVIPTSAHRW